MTSEERWAQRLGYLAAVRRYDYWTVMRAFRVGTRQLDRDWYWRIYDRLHDGWDKGRKLRRLMEGANSLRVVREQGYVAGRIGQRMPDGMSPRSHRGQAWLRGWEDGNRRAEKASQRITGKGE